MTAESQQYPRFGDKFSRKRRARSRCRAVDKQAPQLNTHDCFLIKTGVMCASAGVKRKASPEDTAEVVKRTKVDHVQESSDGT